MRSKQAWRGRWLELAVPAGVVIVILGAYASGGQLLLAASEYLSSGDGSLFSVGVTSLGLSALFLLPLVLICRARIGRGGTGRCTKLL